MVNRFVLNETSYHDYGAISAVADLIAARGFKKAFVRSDPDLIRFGVTKKVTDIPDDACRPGNPRDTSKEEIVELYKALL